MLAGFADRISEHQANIARLEALLEKERNALKELSEIDVPKFMDNMDGQWALDDGRTVVIKTRIHAGIKKDGDDAPRAYKWLEDNGHGALIKNVCLVDFTREQWEDARKLFEELRTRGMNVKRDRGVHHMTLTSWVKKELEKGTALPFDLLGIHKAQETKIKSE